MSEGGKGISTKDIAIIVLIIVLIGSWVYVAITPKAKVTVVTPKTPEDTLLIVMDTGDMVSLDPAQAYEFSSCFVVNQLYDNLVTFKPPDYTTVIPELAETWEISEDGLTWTFHLRKGLTFPSGAKINATAVKYSFERVIMLERDFPAVAQPAWVLTQFINDTNQIEIVDEYTIKIHLHEKVAPGIFLSCLAFSVGGIVDPTVVKQHITTVDGKSDWGNKWLTDHSAGSGPYILKVWERENKIELIANENYWRGAPKIKKIIIKHVPEPTDQMMMLQTGDADIAWDLTTDQILEIKDTAGLKILSIPEFTLRYIGMNVNFTYFKDERVRDAIRYAIDYDGIITGILKGGAVKNQGFIMLGIPGATSEVFYTRNVTKAKELLAEAGYPNGFEVEMIVPPSHPDVDIAAKIQSDLAEIGIKVNIRQVTEAELYPIYRAQQHQMVLAEWGADYVDPDALAKPFADYRVRQLAWRNVWYDDYAANLTEAAAKEMDFAKRLELYKELTEYVVDKGPYVILYQGLRQLAMGRWISGLSPDSTVFFLDLSQVYKESIYYGGGSSELTSALSQALSAIPNIPVIAAIAQIIENKKNIF